MEAFGFGGETNFDISAAFGASCVSEEEMSAMYNAMGLCSGCAHGCPQCYTGQSHDVLADGEVLSDVYVDVGTTPAEMECLMQLASQTGSLLPTEAPPAGTAAAIPAQTDRFGGVEQSEEAAAEAGEDEDMLCALGGDVVPQLRELPPLASGKLGELRVSAPPPRLQVGLVPAGEPSFGENRSILPKLDWPVSYLEVDRSLYAALKAGLKAQGFTRAEIEDLARARRRHKNRKDTSTARLKKLLKRVETAVLDSRLSGEVRNLLLEQRKLILMLLGDKTTLKAIVRSHQPNLFDAGRISNI